MKTGIVRVDEVKRIGQEENVGRGQVSSLETTDIVGKMVKFLALLPAKFNIPSPSLFSWSHGHEAPPAQSYFML